MHKKNFHFVPQILEMEFEELKKKPHKTAKWNMKKNSDSVKEPNFRIESEAP